MVLYNKKGQGCEKKNPGMHWFSFSSFFQVNRIDLTTPATCYTLYREGAQTSLGFTFNGYSSQYLQIDLVRFNFPMFSKLTRFEFWSIYLKFNFNLESAASNVPIQHSCTRFERSFIMCVKSSSTATLLLFFLPCFYCICFLSRFWP